MPDHANWTKKQTIFTLSNGGIIHCSNSAENAITMNEWFESLEKFLSEKKIKMTWDELLRLGKKNVE